MQPEPGQASISRAGSGGTVKKETVRKRGWWCEQRKEIGVCESNFFLKTTSNLKKKNLFQETTNRSNAAKRS